MHGHKPIFCVAFFYFYFFYFCVALTQYTRDCKASSSMLKAAALFLEYIYVY